MGGLCSGSKRKEGAGVGVLQQLLGLALSAVLISVLASLLASSTYPLVGLDSPGIGTGTGTGTFQQLVAAVKDTASGTGWGLTRGSRAEGGTERSHVEAGLGGLEQLPRGTAPTTDSLPPFQFTGVSVRGSGASRCTVGELCSFTVHVDPTATWNVTGSRPLEWDLMVTLEGPALLHAVTEQGQGTASGQVSGQAPGHTFYVTYRSWDEGLYSVTVTNPCFTLVVPGVEVPLYQDQIGQLATWQLFIDDVAPTVDQLPAAASKKDLKHGGQEQIPAPRNLEQSSSAAVHEEACRDTVQGRWVRGKGVPDPEPWRANETQDPIRGTTGLSSAYQGHGRDYGWEPYPCATWQPLGEVLEALSRRGVREIAFVGDSHLRFLLLHTVSLVTGWAPFQLVYAHFDFTVTLSVSRSWEDSPDSGPRSPYGDAGASNVRIVSWKQLHERREAPGVLLSWSEVVNGTSFEMRSNKFSPFADSQVKATEADRMEKEGAQERSHHGSQEKQEAGAEGANSNSTVYSNSTVHSNNTISLSFYWVDGVFKNGEHGCYSRGSFSQRHSTFPSILGNPDLAVLDSGAWSAFRCKLAGLAYTSHLNDFVQEMVVQLQKLGCQRLLFYGSTPNAACYPSTSSPPGTAVPQGSAGTNSLIRFQSRFAELVAAHYGIPYFNTFEVVAPRYTSDCGEINNHYTCTRMHTGADGKPTMITLGGPVGEAVARTFFQFLNSFVSVGHST